MLWCSQIARPNPPLPKLGTKWLLWMWLKFVQGLPKRDKANRPLATNDYMVQKPPCWRASSLLFPHWDVKTETLNSQAWLAFALMFQCRNTNELALQHGGFCTMWSSFVAKSVLVSFHCKLNPSECQQKSPYYLWQSVESFWRSLIIGKNLPWFLRLLKITEAC